MSDVDAFYANDLFLDGFQKKMLTYLRTDCLVKGAYYGKAKNNHWICRMSLDSAPYSSNAVSDAQLKSNSKTP